MTLGQRWVCSGSRSPGAIITSSTRVSSFSSTTRWEPDAATTASSESGHGQTPGSFAVSPISSSSFPQVGFLGRVDRSLYRQPSEDCALQLEATLNPAPPWAGAGQPRTLTTSSTSNATTWSSLWARTGRSRSWTKPETSRRHHHLAALPGTPRRSRLSTPLVSMAAQHQARARTCHYRRQAAWHHEGHHHGWSTSRLSRLQLSACGRYR